MGRADLVVASNRGPLSFSSDAQGGLVRAASAGGLAAALEPLLDGAGATWVSCAMSEADREAAAGPVLRSGHIEVAMVRPDPDVYRMAYDVVSNSTLWFCHHHLFDLARRPRFDRFWHRAWEAYGQLNEAFADMILETAAPGATVLVQDYHLCTVPKLLESSDPTLRCVHFTHTPFAEPAIFRVLPEGTARQVVEGMSAAAACGFHTSRWEAAFRACCEDLGVVPPTTFVSPLTPDPVRLDQRAGSETSRAARTRLRELVGDRKLVLSVDRVEPSKNLLRNLWAYDELLRSHPELRGRVVMVTLAYLSRQGLPEYLAYGAEIESTAAHVNETWGTRDWTPVVLDVADDADRSFAALTLYDVLLVNPIRDGLNLVAKEGPLVNANDGVLALSREAGSFVELREEVLELNPFDVHSTAAALARALSMTTAERKGRAQRLRELVTRRRPGDWLDDQLEAART